MGLKLRNRKIISQTESSINQSQQLVKYKKIDKKHLRLSASRKKNYITKNKKNIQLKLNENIARLADLQKIDHSAFQCSICMEIMIQPAMLVCGHSFCLKCLEYSTAYSNCCPLCRVHQKTQEFISNSSVNSYLHKFIIPKLDQEEYINYLCKTTDYNEWIKRKQPSQLREKMIIDFNDILYVWRRAQITSIVQKDQKSRLVTLRYRLDNQWHFETVQASTRRIANYLFFTGNIFNREFIPEFQWNRPIEVDYIPFLFSNQIESPIMSQDFFRIQQIPEQINQIDPFIHENHEEYTSLLDFLNQQQHQQQHQQLIF